MKKQLQFRNILVEKFSKATFLFILLSSFSFFGQQPSLTVTKTIVENATTCNAFDVTIDVVGVGAARPQEVVLVIDRSGSMGDDTAIPTPIEHAQDAAIAFVNSLFLPSNNPTGLNKVAIVTYSVSASIDIQLTDVSGKQQIINTINSIATGGTTNIEDAMVKARDELNTQATFDCATSRSIVLLTDGVANEDNLGNSCPETIYNTTCQTRAVAAGQNAWVINKSGTDYNQNVFTVGLTGSISGIRQAISLNTLSQIQNSGAYSTENSADLTFIYNQIFGQLNYAALQLPGQSFLTTTIVPGFNVVPGTIQTNKGTATLNSTGNILSWSVPQIATESIYLKYSIVANSSSVCGTQDPEDTEINYQNSICQIISQTLDSPEICVPCPTLTADISRQGCSNFIDYTGTFTNGPCVNFSADYEWKFYLNSVDVGTSNTLSGTFEYTGSDPFQGNFEAVLTFTGSASGGCTIPGITASDSLTIITCGSPNISLIKIGNYNDIDPNGNCSSAVGDVINYTFSVKNTGYVALTNVTVTDPLVTVVGGPIASLAPGAEDTTTFTASYTITQTDIDAGMFSNQATASGTPPTGQDVSDLSDDNSYTENDPTVVTICNFPCIDLIKIGTYDGTDPTTGDCISSPGDLITYIFKVKNTGNVTLTNVTVTDPLVAVIGGPIASMAPGAEDITTFTASYAITQADIDAGMFTNQATATGTPPNGPNATDISDDNSYAEDDPTVVTICNFPCIDLIKIGTYDGTDPTTGDCISSPGDLITYIFKVKNTGNVTLTNVTVTDPLVTVVGGPIASMAPQSEDITTFTATYAITQADIDAGMFTNQATATGTPPNGPNATDISDDNSYAEDDPTVTIICNGPSLSIIKSQTSPAGGVGDIITYDIVVTNNGNVTISNIEITDANAVITGGNPIATLAPGASATVTAEHAITQGDIDQGYVENSAIGTGDSPSGTDDVSDISDTGTDTGGNPIPDPESVETPDGQGNTNGDPTDDPTVTILNQGSGPSISIIKSQTSPAGGLGDIITYDIVVTNTGDVTISNIEITDANAVITGGNPIAVLTPGASATVTAEHTITQGDIDQGYVENSAIGTGDSPNGTDDVTDISDTGTDTAGNTIPDPESVETPDGQGNTNGDPTDDPTVTVLAQGPAIAIVKTSSYDDGGDCSQPGEVIEYTFSVTNEGNIGLSNIIVDDPLLGGPIAGPDSGDTNNNGILDVTETWIYTGQYTITQDDIDNGEVVNQATATGTAPDQTTVTDESGTTTTTDDPTTTILCQGPVIAIVKKASYDNGGDCSKPGEVIDYTFTVTNEGNVSLGNIMVDDPLLGGPIAGPDSGDTNNDGILDLTEIWIYTGSYTITQDDIDNGEVVNQATATGTTLNQITVTDESGSTTTTNDPTTTILCQGPAIAIVKTASYDDGGDCSQPGELINYTFTVTNEGNVTLSNIIVDDPLLGGPIAGPDSGDDDNDGMLDVTETWIYTASYTITQDDIDNGEVVNQATATATFNQTTVSDESGSTTTTDDPTITTLCQNPNIAIVKVSSYDDGGDCSQPGEIIYYTFTVTNEGNVTLSNIIVDDPLLGGPIAGPDSGDDDNDGKLDVTEAWIYTGSYVITQLDIDGGQVVNQATATGTAPDQTTVSDLSGSTTTSNDPTTTILCNGASIALIKTGVIDDANGNGCGDVGENIDYSFSVKNTGSVALTNVIVTDPLVNVVGGPIASLSPGAEDTNTFTATYTITQNDIDAGSFTNQATATGTPPSGSNVTDDSDESSYTGNDPTVTVLCQNPSISLEKTGVFNDENGDGGSDIGETVSYNFTVTNTGNVTLYDVTITDPLPGIQISGGPIAVMLPGDSDSSTFTATYAITQQDIDNLNVTNQAIVTGNTNDGTLVTDESDDPTDLTNIDHNGDGDPDDPTVVILPGVLDTTFEIYNGITPNGDGSNDFFLILGIHNYPNNNVKIYNRWGVLVFETDGYGRGDNDDQNVFRGISEGRATVQKNKELPTGTYYYILTFPAENPGKSSYNGYLYINR